MVGVARGAGIRDGGGDGLALAVVLVSAAGVCDGDGLAAVGVVGEGGLLGDGDYVVAVLVLGAAAAGVAALIVEGLYPFINRGLGWDIEGTELDWGN